MKQGLTVLCACIRKKRILYCGHRHNNILNQPGAMSKELFGYLRNGEQGFLLSNGKFASRHQALIIAIKVNQVDKDKLTAKRSGLFSEDLY